MLGADGHLQGGTLKRLNVSHNFRYANEDELGSIMRTTLCTCEVLRVVQIIGLGALDFGFVLQALD